jgi:hypothetical protein
MQYRLAGRLAAAALVLVLLGWAFTAYQRESRTITYSIPVGTAARLAAGERVTVFPDEIRLSLRRQDTLVIRNNDREAVTIGPFRIAPGQQYRQRYWSAGTYDLVCSVHSGNQLRIVVEP